MAAPEPKVANNIFGKVLGKVCNSNMGDVHKAQVIMYAMKCLANINDGDQLNAPETIKAYKGGLELILDPDRGSTAGYLVKG